MWPAGGESLGQSQRPRRSAHLTAERQRGNVGTLTDPPVHLGQTEVFFRRAEGKKKHNRDGQEPDWGFSAFHLQADRECVGRLVYSAE